jgi:methyl-accepting chemotaxis protein
VTKARQVDDLVGEIAAASKEQAQGIAQVNIAVTQMDKITQSNAAGAEESASASEEMSAQARVLKDSVSELSELVGVKNSKSGKSAEPVKSKSRTITSHQNHFQDDHTADKSEDTDETLELVN